MIRCALILAHKDLRLILTRSAGLSQAVLLGLLLVFMFSLSLQAGERLSPQAASTMFWLASVFCQIIIFQMLYLQEEHNQARTGLLLLPAPIQSVWLGKFFSGLCLLCLAQCIFIPSMFVFLGQSIGKYPEHALIAIVLTNIGMCACGSLLGALCVGQSGRESILSIILFPLLIPLLLAAIRLTSIGLAEYGIESYIESTEILRWHGLALAFDAIFLASALILFPYLYGGEN